MLAMFRDEIAGIIVEPLQGAAAIGWRCRGFLGLERAGEQIRMLFRIRRSSNRRWPDRDVWAIDQFDLPHPPQAVASAKKLGNGVVYMLYPMDDHGVLDSTWGGTLSDMVRFVQEMKIVMREQLIERVPAKAAKMQAGLDKLAREYPKVIFNPRGMGIYRGFSLRADRGFAILGSRAGKRTPAAAVRAREASACGPR